MLLGQIILTLAIQELRILGLAQAAGLALFGLYSVIRRDLASLLCVMAYLTGAEIVWRQVRAPVFYLAAPYLLIVLSVFAVVLVLGRLGRDSRLALLYAGLLVPAVISTIRTTGAGSRELIAFALSGPLALAAFVAFTSQVKVERWLYRRILWTTLITAAGPLTVAVQSTRSQLASAGSIHFKSASNFVTSGGFGPVQVSSMLSLGAMAAVLLILSESDRFVRILAAVIATALVVQTLLTFSRGGSTSLAIAVTGLALVNAKSPRIRNRILVIAAVAFTVGYLLVFPWLETFTGGAFNERFSDTQSARTTLAGNDIKIFEDNFLFGVGPGMTKYQRLTYEVCQLRSDKCKDEASSHTEFTRMLGEHGVPGAMAIVIMGLLAVNSFRRRGEGRALAFTWMLWAISQMFYANLRIVAVPFAFGLAFLRLSDEGDVSERDPDSPDEELWTDGNPMHVPTTDWSEDPPGRKRTIGFGAGYGPPEHTGPEHIAQVGFGAGWGAPRATGGSGPDTSQRGSTRPEL